jgi:hypothetical protein
MPLRDPNQPGVDLFNTGYTTTSTFQPPMSYGKQFDPLAEIKKLEAQRASKTKARETEVRSILDEIIAQFGPGGSYGQGILAMLERQKEKDVASATQSLVSAGLYGTTMASGVGKKWEEEIGMPTRAKLEDVKAERLAQAKQQKAQFVTDIEEEGIDYNTIANLMQQASSNPIAPSNSYGGYQRNVGNIGIARTR